MEPVSISLAFRIGEVTLFERRLDGFADRRHFSEQPVVADVAGLPLESPAAADFYFFPTYPVQEPPKPYIRRGGWIYYTPYTFRNYYVDVKRLGTFDVYLGQFSGKSRSTLRRKVKRFAEVDGGMVDWRFMSHPDEMSEFLRLALPLSAKTYQERLLSAGLPKGAEFEERLQREAESGGAMAYLLFLKQQPVAYVLCFVRGRIATYDYVGYDPSVQALSPGTVLQYLMLESMFKSNNLDIFDFTEGEGAQKQFFASDHRLCAKTYVLRDTIGNRNTVQLHRLVSGASTLAGTALERLAIRDKIRKAIRSWA